MKKLALLLFITLLGALAAQTNAQGLAIGGKVDNFSLADTNGQTQTLNDLKGTNGTVVVFLSIQCPVVRGYNDRINQFAADYKAKGINIVGINSNATEASAAVKAHADQHYKFTVLIDKGNVLADKLGAMSTPEVFFFDANNTLIYHGAIDNDARGNNITDSYLKAAFDASLGGKPIARTTTHAIGCSIRRVGE